MANEGEKNHALELLDKVVPVVEIFGGFVADSQYLQQACTRLYRGAWGDACGSVIPFS